MHTTESANKNDIVSQLGITGTGFGGPAAWGAPYFNVQGYSPMGDNYVATPMHAWDTVIEGRDTLNWQIGRHSASSAEHTSGIIWPMWGFFQNRGYYQFTNGFTTQNRSQRRNRIFAGQLPARPSSGATGPGRRAADGSSAVVCGRLCKDAWRLTANTTLTYGLRYEFMSPLVDIRYTNSNLDLSTGTPQAFIGGQNGYPKGLMYANHTNFAPRIGLAYNMPHLGIGCAWAYGTFYTPVDMNTWCNQRHNVPYVFPAHFAKRSVSCRASTR